MRPLALTLLFSLAVTPFVIAQEPWDAAPLTAGPKAVLEAAEKIPAGESDLVILLDETKHSFDERGRGTTTQRFLYRIAADSAIENWATINAGWAPWVQEKPVIQARVITKDGTVHMLDDKALVETPAPEESLDIFSDNRVIRAPLPAVAVGSVVEQFISYKSKDSLYDGAASDVFFFGSYKPVHRARLIVDAPASLALHLVNKSSVQPQREEKDGRVTIRYEGGPFAAVDDIEWHLPYDVAPLPWVGVATGSSWGDLARRYTAIVEKQMENAGLEQATREAVGNAKDRKEIVARALAWIQKRVRYAGVEVGESSVVPRPPQTVLGNRYGDCKDKATLLVAMLRQAGVTAHVALLRAGEDFDVPRDLPGLGMFNHAIVIVPGENGAAPIWVDPTDEYSRAGELPTMDQGRLALVASDKTTSLVETPVSDSAANRTIETRTFVIPEEGKAKVTEITEGTGTDESSMRRQYVTSDRKRYKEAMEQYAQNYYNGKTLEKLDASDAHDLGKPFRIQLDVGEAGRGIAIDGEAAVAIFPGALIDTLPWSLRDYDPDDEESKAKKRKNDFVMSRPSVREWRYRIVPPEGFVARTLPKNETTTFGTATLKKEYRVAEDGAVLAEFRFDTGKRRLAPSEVDAIRKTIGEYDSSQVVMIGFDQRGQLELINGNISAALAEFRKLAAKHPKEGRHQVEIAKALLSGGMADAAREQIKKAIALEPSYARAHRMQGIILQHDLLGRPYRKGFDLPGAIAAYKKAKELDPKDKGIRAELAKLLEYGEEGLLFGKNARLDESIAEWRALVTELDEPQYEPELHLAMARAAKWDELKASVATASNAIQQSLWRAVATAATEGAPAAIREASSVDQSHRKELLRNAAGVLVTMRMYGPGADLMEEAMQGSPSAEQRTQIESLRKAKRVEELPMPENDPKTIVRRLVIDAVLSEIDADLITRYFVADAKTFFESEANRAEWRVARVGLLNVAREQGLPLAFYADVGMGNVQMVQDGDDETGYRVRMRTAAARGTTEETLFVVKENGQYRISATRKAPALIGWSVLRLVDAGKLDAARQWLNWTREEFPQAGGDDPLATSPFSRYWPKSKASATAEELRIAAAMLLPSKELSARSVEILSAAREKATTDDERVKLDHGLSLAYIANENAAELAKVAERLLAAHTDSATAFNFVSLAYTRLQRHDDVTKLANARLEKMERDPDALRALGGAAMYSGDYAACDRYYRQIIDELRPSAGDYNNIAWNALLSGKDLTRALDEARQAMQLPGGGAASLLHTLASLYAETGKSLEAREALLQSMDSAGREEPAPHDWYVLGRIAENYGVTDAAMSAYKRVSDEDTSKFASTTMLAERRMKAIGRR